MNTNPDKYKWGLFYFDPRDSRLIVPKVNWMMGWTLNFGNPLTYLVLVVFLGFIVFLGTL